MRGVQIGLTDVHYAILTADTPAAATYQTPVRIFGAITANINPNASSETLFADDGPMAVASTLGQIELELVASELPLDVQAVLLGHGAPVNGEIFRKAGDIPPWVALGFRALKSNGKYRFMWLLKGKFMVPEQPHETLGDAITFQTATINGFFVRRERDAAYQRIGDEDLVGFSSTGWFTTARINNPSA